MPKDRDYNFFNEGYERHRPRTERKGHTKSKYANGVYIPVDTYMSKYESHLKRRDIYEEVDESYEGFVL